MDIVCVLLAMNVFIIFMVRRQWLFNKRSFTILLLLNAVVFLTGYLLTTHHIGNPRFTPLLKVPFIYQLLFIPMQWLFRIIVHRDPVDTFWSDNIKLMKDGIFNFMYAVLFCVIIILVY